MQKENMSASTLWGEGNGTPLQHSCLENSMDGGAWWATVHGVAKSQTRLSDFNFTFHFHVLEKAMATHSSVLALRIPGMGEPCGLLSMRSHRVGHDWSDLAAAAAPFGLLFPFNLNRINTFFTLWLHVHEMRANYFFFGKEENTNEKDMEGKWEREGGSIRWVCISVRVLQRNTTDWGNRHTHTPWTHASDLVVK